MVSIYLSSMARDFDIPAPAVIIPAEETAWIFH